MIALEQGSPADNVGKPRKESFALIPIGLVRTWAFGNHATIVLLGRARGTCRNAKRWYGQSWSRRVKDREAGHGIRRRRRGVSAGPDQAIGHGRSLVRIVQ